VALNHLSANRTGESKTEDFSHGWCNQR